MGMSDSAARTSIKLYPDTHDRLQALKRDGESWDELLDRLAEYGELVQSADHSESE